ncbi:adenosylcobinamide-GDP ribazoletransferase [Clostridium aciditolerans]|uniref:Adenosylcobinamide-GDP ribazoletransferase n=1 Tax=Clostridium aciditolerans TaxID=339861 RepID=A0A934HUY1_9CLOT|nr:adenosylcobinamide-GDP ribazoletransferase [Clostridium aciditolerans]MBI6873783.1 adenosylcobinamide-GDP ribazoletransferase [Clostridium aciditolerans]
MKEVVCNFLLMIQFLTRIPVNISLPCEKDNFRRASIFFPVIGLVVGGIQWVVYKLLVNIIPIDAVIIIILIVGVIVTGAIHIDGLGDTCDGFFAFKGSDRIIEIMKDSRIGTYACIAMVMDLLLKYTLFSFIVPKFSVAIIAVPMISRCSVLFLGFKGKTAKSTGTGNFFIGNVGIAQFIIGLVITLGVLALLMTPRYIVILLIAALILSLIFNLFCEKRIGGLTGDTLGANNELVEILTLILISIMLKI